MSAADDVKQRLDIVSIVGSYVPLARSGRSFKALCPFHQEKTASFYVFPESQTWRCFGSCATGGDIFAFVMKREGMLFGEALRTLAAQAGVALPEWAAAAPKDDDRSARLREALQAAALYFHNALLNSPEAAAARAYVEQRGISPEAVRTFMLGYSPAGWQRLKDHLIGVGFPEDELLAAGLLTESQSQSAPSGASGQRPSGASGQRSYDRFRDRLMFPIHDQGAQLIAFGARALTPDALPKYLNSPQNVLFDKSANVYGLHLAKDAIRRQRQAVIVEGYMDALTAHQFGFSNVVASMGTSLTEKQVALLSRYASSLVLALDADAAGESATLRGLEVAPEAMGQEDVPVPAWRGRVRRRQIGGRQVFTRLPEGGFRTVGGARGEVRVLRLPAGKDPDELVRRDPQQWGELVAASVPMLDFLFASVRERFDLSSPSGKADAVEMVLPFLAQVPNPVEQAHYLQRLATMVSVDEQTLRASLPAKRRTPQTAEPAEEGAAEASEVRQRIQHLEVLEDYCLALLLRFESLAQHSDGLRADHFLSPETRELYGIWEGSRSQAAAGEVDPALLPRLRRVQAVSLPPMTETLARAALAQCIHRLEERRLRDLKAQQRQQLSEEETDQGVSELARSAYQQWKQGSDPKHGFMAIPMADLPSRELAVNKDLQELMRPRRLSPTQEVMES